MRSSKICPLVFLSMTFLFCSSASITHQCNIGDRDSGLTKQVELSYELDSKKAQNFQVSSCTLDSDEREASIWLTFTYQSKIKKNGKEELVEATCGPENRKKKYEYKYGKDVGYSDYALQKTVLESKLKSNDELGTVSCSYHDAGSFKVKATYTGNRRNLGLSGIIDHEPLEDSAVLSDHVNDLVKI